MKNLVKLAAVAMALAPIQAQAEDVNFGGSVTNNCTIVVDNAGTLGVNLDNTVLSSTAGSGTSGAATVSSTGPDFTLDASVTSFSGTADSTSTSMGVSGANTGSGTSVDLTSAGSNSVGVDFTANKAAGFSTGSYSSVVTLTCSE